MKKNLLKLMTSATLLFCHISYFSQMSSEDVLAGNKISPPSIAAYTPCPTLVGTSTITNLSYCNGITNTIAAASFSASNGNPSYFYTYFNNANQSVNQNSCALPGYGSTYTAAQTRGLWFICPTNTVLTGVRVPTDVGTANQFVYILKMAAIPPEFASSTTTYTVLGKYLDIAGTGTINCGIPLNTGDIIGVLGVRGSTATANASSSYATPAGPFTTSIGGINTTLKRFIYQSNIATTTLGAVSSASTGAIGRVELYFGTSISNTNTANGLIPGNYSCYYTDSDGCMNTSTFVINPAATITAVTSATNATCSLNPMAASVSPSAGIGAYTYSWSPTGGTSATTGSLTAGTYSCLITDASGNCLTTTVNVQDNIVIPTLSVSMTSSAICVGQSVTLTATGSSTNYIWNGITAGSSYTDTPVSNSNYTVVAGAGSCTNSAVTSLIVSSCTGIDNLNNQFVMMVYPNPTYGSLSIQSSLPAHVEITNALGQVFFEGNVDAGTNVLELSTYGRGIYHLKISTDQGNRFIKVVKN